MSREIINAKKDVNVQNNATSVATVCSQLILSNLNEEIWYDTACALYKMKPAMRANESGSNIEVDVLLS